ncbi:MAG: type II toxin-antitoxin system RelE/ParE family toxin [Acidobacteria bacterium]|nr:type II toxin-antitoxin system RelE/ParE family toxin [Acidobacteriota bacterium]
MRAAERAEIVTFLAMHPDAGDVIAGSGGARKLRFPGRNKGKSGGYRVITFYTGPAFPLFLLNAFAKNERTNITKAECAALKTILSAIAAKYLKGKESK